MAKMRCFNVDDGFEEKRKYREDASSFAKPKVDDDVENLIDHH